MSDQETEKKGIRRREFLKNAGLIASGTAFGSAALPVYSNAYAPASVPAGNVALEVLNPRGAIDPPPRLGISPRIATLEGKKIALIHNNEPGAKTFLDAMQEHPREFLGKCPM